MSQKRIILEKAVKIENFTKIIFNDDNNASVLLGIEPFLGILGIEPLNSLN